MRGGRGWLGAGALAAFLGGAGTASAAPVTYVHPSAPSCGGSSPCFSTIAAAIQNVDNGGTIILLASKADNIFQTFGKTGVTVRGNVPSIVLTGGVNVTSDVMTGWTIRDVQFTGGMGVRNIATAFTVQNVAVTGISLGNFTNDTNAAITVSNVTFPGGPGALISILGGPGADIGGTINITDNVNLYALNVFSYATSANPAHITANMTVSGNHFITGTNIVAQSDGSGGVANVTGNIQFLNNTMDPVDGALGVITFGPVVGDITGPITFTGNSGKAVIVNTTDSAGGAVGSILVNGNDIEAVEIDAKGGALVGPVLVAGNNVTDHATGAPEGPKIQASGQPVAGDVTVDNNTGGGAFIATMSSNSPFTGLVRIRNNVARRIVIDSQSGDLVTPFTVSGNTLAPAAGFDSTLTVRTGPGGNLSGGVLTGNVLDGIQFDIGRGLAGTLTMTSNKTREKASFIAAGPVGTGTAAVTGNDFTGVTYFQGMNSVLRFNRIYNEAYFVPGASMDARYNWWGCNAGPGAAPCTVGSGGVPVFPWLVFNAETRCTSGTSAVQAVRLLSAADASTPAGNVAPGTATVTTSQGSVSPSTISFAGAGAATVTLPAASTATITSTLDAASVSWPVSCDPDRTTVALYAPSLGRFYLRNRNSAGFADAVPSFGPPGLRPLLGDWNGDGTQTPGVYDPASGVFLLRNSITTGFADVAFTFGPIAGSVPIVGDWNGDGVDTVGLYVPSTSQFFLRNANTTGFADVAFSFGPGGAGWLPVVGDWNGDGTDTVGLYAPSTSQFFLRNSNSGGFADVSFTFGAGGAGWLPIVGDWDGNGADTVGLYVPSSSQFLLRNSNTNGVADVSFSFGPGGAGWLPLAGDFDGPH
jgi:hypothetical protein